MSNRINQLRKRHEKTLLPLEEKLKLCKKPIALREMVLDCLALFANMKCGWCHDNRIDLSKHIEQSLKDWGTK